MASMAPSTLLNLPDPNAGTSPLNDFFGQYGNVFPGLASEVQNSVGETPAPISSGGNAPTPAQAVPIPTSAPAAKPVLLPPAAPRPAPKKQMASSPYSKGANANATDFAAQPLPISSAPESIPNVQPTVAQPSPDMNAIQPNAAMGTARMTMYNGKDDQYGTETAKPNRLGQSQAIPGETIAVDPKVIPYGSYVKIPGTESASAHGDGVWYAHDTGGDVKSEKAAGGKTPVIDMYTSSDNLNNPAYNKNFQYQVLSQPPAWAAPTAQAPAEDVAQTPVQSQSENTSYNQQ